MTKLQVPPDNSYFLVGSKVLRVLRCSSATDKIWVRDLDTGEKQEYRFATFMVGAKRVLPISELAKLLNRTRRMMLIYEHAGTIRPGLRAGNNWRFYTLEQAMEIRDDLADIHIGRPRKDGKITNNTMLDKGNFKMMIRERYGWNP